MKRHSHKIFTLDGYTIPIERTDYLSPVNYMQILLSCTECEFEDWGRTESEMMNKITMWNHVRKAHASTAEHLMKMYQTLPNNLYTTSPMQPAR